MENKYSIAGKELVKGNFGNALTAIKSMGSELIQPSRYRNGNFFFGVNGADKAFIWGNYNSSLKAYQQCPVVSAVINKMAQASVNGKEFIMDDSGKESNTPQAKALKQLRFKPNPMQSGKEFKAQGNVYKRIYGYCPVLVMKPAGFETDFSRWTMWNLPPWMIQVLDNTGLFYEEGIKPFASIWLRYMGQSVNVTDNVYFIKENQISTGTYNSSSAVENVSMYLPDSKLHGLQSAIENFIASLTSRGSLVTERGPQWILTNDQSDTGDAGLFPLDPKQKEELQNDWRKHGIGVGQRKAIITDAKLKLQTVGFDVAQLKLLEGELQDAKMICDGLNYPPYLLGLVDAKFDNQQIAERGLYTNSIIPDVESENEQWAEIFGLRQLGLKIVTDFSHLPAMQENIAEQGKGRFYMNQGLLIEFLNNQITANRWRILLGEDTVAGDDLFYWQKLQQTGMIFGVVPNAAPALGNQTQQNN